MSISYYRREEHPYMEEISQDYCVCAYNLSHTRTQQFARNALYTAVPLGEITHTFANRNESVIRCPAAFEELHRAELAVYEAACAYFKANGLRTLPDLKKLDAEYQTLSSEKNGFYTRYKKAQIELRELRTAQQNVEAFFRKEERSHAVPQQEVK